MDYRRDWRLSRASEGSNAPPELKTEYLDPALEYLIPLALIVSKVESSKGMPAQGLAKPVLSEAEGLSPNGVGESNPEDNGVTLQETLHR